jgi:CRP-like cAMP-binding protein
LNNIAGLMVDSSTHYKNTILKALPSEAVARLNLVEVSYPFLQEIQGAGQMIDQLYFVEEGLASMTTIVDGSEIEVAVLGYETIIGVSALMRTELSMNRIYTQIAGRGYCCPLKAARREFARGKEFQWLALRCIHAQMVEIAQTAGCNARHSIEQRLARRLLVCADRTQSTRLTMSQEFLGAMLGYNRATVSKIAGALKEEHVIDYSRGAIRILDMQRLQERACECYRVVKDHLERLTEFDGGITA